MTWMLKCHGGLVQTAHGVVDAPAGEYLQSADHDAGGPDSPLKGLAVWTPDPAEAMQFDTPGAAMEFWRKPSTVVPLRPDGKPNRPLTAFTVEVVKGPTP